MGQSTLTQVAALDAITANVGWIASGGTAAAFNIKAPQLAVRSRHYGVGAAGLALGTQTSLAEINAYTGSIYMNNTGNLRVGISNTNGLSRTNLYPGIQVLATTGNHVVDLGVTGVMSAPLISDTIKAPGAITVTVGGNIEAGLHDRGRQRPLHLVAQRVDPCRIDQRGYPARQLPE